MIRQHAASGALWRRDVPQQIAPNALPVPVPVPVPVPDFRASSSREGIFDGHASRRGPAQPSASECDALHQPPIRGETRRETSCDAGSRSPIKKSKARGSSRAKPSRAEESGQGAGSPGAGPNQFRRGRGSTRNTWDPRLPTLRVNWPRVEVRAPRSKRQRRPPLDDVKHERWREEHCAVAGFRRKNCDERCDLLASWVRFHPQTGRPTW